MVQFVRHSGILCSLTFSIVISLSFPKSKSNWARRPTFELTSSIKGEYIICKDLADFLPMGITRSASGPTHGEVIFPFACFCCFMITVPFVLSYCSSRYWYKNGLLLMNPRLKKPQPLDVCILLSV